MPELIAIPSLQQLHDNALHYLQAALSEASETDPDGLTAALARDNNRVLAFVLGAGQQGAYQYLRDYIAKQAIPIYSRGDFLTGWMESLGIPRKPAVPASGTIAIPGTVGATLPAGTEYQLSGRYYIVQADVSVGSGGTATAAAIALDAGASGNQAVGASLALVNPVSGIDATATVIGMAGGEDAEKDEDAVYRVRQRLTNPPAGGAPGDYERWALSVAGITRAWGLRNPAGACTAGVIIMADGNGNHGIPTTGQQTAVADYIGDPDRGPCDELFVILPTAKIIAHTIHISPDTPAIRAAVESELQDLYYREGIPGGSIPHTHLVEAVSIAAGEYTHTFTVPAITSGGALTATAYEILVYGGVAWA